MVTCISHKAIQENENALVLPLPETRVPQPQLVNGEQLHKLLLTTDDVLSEVNCVTAGSFILHNASVPEVLGAGLSGA